MRGGYYSLRIKLNDIVWDIEYEQKIMENLRYCNNLNKNEFKIIFWYENLSKKEIKDFVERNKEMLLDINIDITKSRKTDAWFIINSSGEKNFWRYRYDGDILGGISEYIKIIKHIRKKDK